MSAAGRGRRRWPWALWACACAASSASAARADDWLVSLPPCSTAPATPAPRFELVYPRAGLPALLQAGDDLVARVRLPSPLTPPPGVQQPRALVGFAAELIGHALALAPGGAAAPEHRYAIEAVDVRPDTGSSLLYRVTLRVPAFVAPGTYDLTLSAPGGAGRVNGVVRVLGRGQPPRLAWIGDPRDLAGVAVAALPVDVWLHRPPSASDARSADAAAAGGAPAPGAAPLFEPGALALAVRMQQTLWVLGDCGSATGPFASEIGTALARERLTRGAAPRVALPSGQFRPAGAAEQPLPDAAALRIDAQPGALKLAVGSSFAGPAELSVLVPAAQEAQIEGAAARFYPASEIARSGVPSRVARLQIAAGASATLTGLSAPPRASRYALVALPELARSGERVRFAVRPAHAQPAHSAAQAPQVAFRFDPLHSAFGPHAAEHAFIALGAQRVHALVIEPDGHAYPLQAEVRVQTARGAGCSSAGPATPSLWSALLLLQRRAPGRRRRSAAEKHANCTTRE